MNKCAHDHTSTLFLPTGKGERDGEEKLGVQKVDLKIIISIQEQEQTDRGQQQQQQPFQVLEENCLCTVDAEDCISAGASVH